MNAQNLPGFTAEVALYASGGSYYTMPAWSAGASRIIPQERASCLAFCVCW
jgi:hypothetical protein